MRPDIKQLTKCFEFDVEVLNKTYFSELSEKKYFHSAS